MTLNDAYRIIGIPEDKRLHPYMAHADRIGMPATLALDRWRAEQLSPAISAMYAALVTDRGSDRLDVIEAAHAFDEAVEILTHLIP